MAKTKKTIEREIPAEAPPQPAAPRSPFRLRVPPRLLYAAGVLVLMVVFFRPVLGADHALLTTGDNFGQLTQRKGMLPGAFLGTWGSGELLGFPVRLTPNFVNTMLWLLPAGVYADWFHGMALALGSLFLGLFLRRRGMSWAGICVATLTAYWLGSNFTLIFAGHTGKFGLLLFTGLFLWCLDIALERKTWAWTVLAGGAFGGLLMDQQDLGWFFALAMGPYALLRSRSAYGAQWGQSLRFLAALVAVAGLVSFHALWSTYRQDRAGDIPAAAKDPERAWEALTQWSWPPEESIDFVAPGFMGWRSGDPAGPYWGRMGRSADWESTKQGFGNFKLENQYLGVLPILFSLWAFFAALRLKGRDPEGRAEVLFWSAVCVATFLLSCGKHIEPLYRAFLSLPVFASVSNPNKFLQLHQVATALLAGYGIDAVFGRRREVWMPALSRAFHVSFVSVTGLTLALVAIWWMGSAGSVRALAESMGARGFGDGAVIADNMIRSLGHAAAMLAISGGALALFTLRSKVVSRELLARCGAFLAAVVAIDAVMLSRNYIQSMDVEPIFNNRVAELLKANLGQQRVAMTTQAGFYNSWLTYLFPYHGIPSLNITAAPRLAEDYRRFLGEVGRDSLRLWQFAGVGYILAPGNVWSDLSRNPATREQFELHYAYNAEPVGLTSVRVTDATEANPGKHCVIKFKGAAHRFALVDRWDVVSNDEALTTLADPAFQPFSKVLLSPDREPPPPPDRPQGGLLGQIQVQTYLPHHVVIRTSAERDAILRIADKFDPGWKAWVDGQPATIHRCDYIMRGVHVPAGMHSVELRYQVPNPTLWVQIAALGLCGVAGVSAWRGRRKADAVHGDQAAG